MTLTDPTDLKKSTGSPVTVKLITHNLKGKICSKENC